MSRKKTRTRPRRISKKKKKGIRKHGFAEHQAKVGKRRMSQGNEAAIKRRERLRRQAKKKPALAHRNTENCDSRKGHAKEHSASLNKARQTSLNRNRRRGEETARRKKPRTRNKGKKTAKLKPIDEGKSRKRKVSNKKKKKNIARKEASGERTSKELRGGRGKSKQRKEDRGESLER